MQTPMNSSAQTPNGIVSDSPAIAPDRFVANRRQRVRQGFTLVEVMVATVIFAMTMLGVYTMLMRAYELTALTRYRNDARAVTQSFADQFERLATTKRFGSVDYTVELFDPMTTAGAGLDWQDTTNAPLISDTTSRFNPSTSAALSITLGGVNGIPATVSRVVTWVDPSTGADRATPYNMAGGYLLRGTFTTSYNVNGKAYSQSLTVIRAVP